ncbi:MAG: NAD(P)H-dependent oxidoreductase subunit E [Endomicrobium sp.]|jgi:NADH-quinone oxidoreductase subunit E|nr:NAD(P)H-dependent oxidoreductase subunit E [Endomicrobium sp.]
MGLNYNKFEKTCKILEENEFDKSKLISILQGVQEEYKYLPEDILAFIASSLNMPLSKVYGVVTFFSFFTLQPKGKYIIKICDGTACHVKKSTGLIDAIKKKLGLKDDEILTKNMLFSIETVACLGACGLAPVIVVDGVVYGQATPNAVVRLIDNVLKEEKEK